MTVKATCAVSHLRSPAAGGNPQSARQFDPHGPAAVISAVSPSACRNGIAVVGGARILTPVGHWTSSPRRELAHAAGVLWTYSPELYELLVLRCGMPLRQHGRFAADAMTGTLLPSEQPDIRP
jgi:hypothetical protein